MKISDCTELWYSECSPRKSYAPACMDSGLRALTLETAFSGFTMPLKSSCHYLPVWSPAAKTHFPSPQEELTTRSWDWAELSCRTHLQPISNPCGFYPIETKFHAGRICSFFFFFSTDVSPLPLQSCLVHSRCTMKIYWMNECMLSPLVLVQLHTQLRTGEWRKTESPSCLWGHRGLGRGGQSRERHQVAVLWTPGLSKEACWVGPGCSPMPGFCFSDSELYFEFCSLPIIWLNSPLPVFHSVLCLSLHGILILTVFVLSSWHSWLPLRFHF